ncbi:MAG: hypothetical protein U0326_10390 [Polyangiales bacterium]
MSRIRSYGRLALIACGAFALPSTAAAVEYTEAQVYGIANFGGAGECGTSGQTHTVHTSTAAAFLGTFSALQALGQWDQTSTRNNTSARGSYFTDSTKAGACVCTADDLSTDYGLDDADVVYVHTHGGHTADAATGAYRTSLTTGNASYDCSVRTDDNMLFGNTSSGGDLGIAVIKACQSGDYDVWQNGGYRQRFSVTDGSFRVWNAFHGDSSCGNHVTTYVGSYSGGSTYEGVGENWLDEAYDDDAGADNDDCPVSIVMGASSAQRDDMYEHGGWLDRKATGDKTGSTYYFMASCDPSHGVVLPAN